MATMDRDLDALERALQAVKTRSANALLNEQSYLARIAQLEEVNRSLQAQLTAQGAAPVADASCRRPPRLEAPRRVRRGHEALELVHVDADQIQPPRGGAARRRARERRRRPGRRRTRRHRARARARTIPQPQQSPPSRPWRPTPRAGSRSAARRVWESKPSPPSSRPARRSRARTSSHDPTTSPPPPPRDRRCRRRNASLFVVVVVDGDARDEHEK